MKAIHVNWTKPYFEKHRLRGHGFETIKNMESETYNMSDYQIFFTILSILNWKEFNGPIKLYTDSIGASFYHRFGILDLYDEVDIKYLNNYSKSDVDAAYYWTSGKIKCLAHQTEQFVFLDNDMIIREKLPIWVKTNDLTIAHWEIGRGYYYFDEEKFNQEIDHMNWIENYNVDDWSPNTSFLCFNNMDLLKKYHNWHKKLVKTERYHNVPEWYWLLTDQGILGHVIRENDYHVNTLTQKIALANHNTTLEHERYKGKAEKWYLPVNYTRNKEVNFDHVWLDKIGWNINPQLYDKTMKGWFEEIVYHYGMGKLLSNDVRWKKYWNKYGKNS